MERWLERLLTDRTAADGTLAVDHRAAQKLWAYRERITESLQPWTPRKNDISVPVSRLAEFVVELQRWLDHSRPGWQVALFGHVGDGNLHINALRPEGMAMVEFQQACDLADEALYQLVARFGGSMSAEHGIGLVKKRWLPLFRSKAELQALGALKHALDPAGILNPGKVLS